MVNITIGQYYPEKSYIHRLDPRIKLLATIIFVVMLFFVSNFTGYLYVGICLSAVIYASRVPIGFMLRGLKSVFAILMFAVFLNIFFAPGEVILVEFGIITITLEGVLLAAKMAIRLVMLIIGSSLLTLTTTPMQLTDGIEYSLKPLKKIGVPSHDIAMMMTIALRFIPTLLEETDKIMKAQKARGADFDTGNLIQKAKSLLPLLVPLFISAFRRADELAMAMEARCYRGDMNRTRMRMLKLSSLDYKALALIIGFCVINILISFMRVI